MKNLSLLKYFSFSWFYAKIKIKNACILQCFLSYYYRDRDRQIHFDEVIHRSFSILSQIGWNIDYETIICDVIKREVCVKVQFDEDIEEVETRYVISWIVVIVGRCESSLPDAFVSMFNHNIVLKEFD